MRSVPIIITTTSFHGTQCIGGDTEPHQEGRFCWQYPQARGTHLLNYIVPLSPPPSSLPAGVVITFHIIFHLCFQLDRVRFVLCSYLRNRLQKVNLVDSVCGKFFVVHRRAVILLHISVEVMVTGNCNSLHFQ